MTIDLPMFRTLVILLTVTSAVPASAVSCYAESERYTRDGAAYFDMGVAPRIPPAQQRVFSGLIERLEGEWQGEGDALYCKGSQSAPRADSRRFESSLTVRKTGEMVIRIDEQRGYSDEASSRVTHVTLAIADIELLELDAEHMVAIEKYRRLGMNDVSNLWEVVHELRLVAGGLQYTTTRYVNGLLSSHDQRRLQR